MDGSEHDVARRTILMSAGIGIGAGLVSGLSQAQAEAATAASRRGNLELGILGAARAA